jgi:hypothetical protein
VQLGTVRASFRWSFWHRFRGGFKWWLQAREAAWSWSQPEASKLLRRSFDCFRWFLASHASHLCVVNLNIISIPCFIHWHALALTPSPSKMVGYYPHWSLNIPATCFWRTWHDIAVLQRTIVTSDFPLVRFSSPSSMCLKHAFECAPQRLQTHALEMPSNAPSSAPSIPSNVPP